MKEPIYCINMRCQMKNECELAKLMNKEWFLEHIADLSPEQLVFYNAEQNKKCKYIKLKVAN